MSPLDLKKLLEELNSGKVTDRQSRSVYVSEGIYRQFAEWCRKNHVSVGEVLERLMLSIVENKKNKKDAR